MRRDGDMADDDTVSIVLDTYGDRRIQINAVGARVDGFLILVMIEPNKAIGEAKR
jgi:hypothetical protein